MVLQDRINQVLVRRARAISAAQIATELEVEVKKVNAILYRQRGKSYVMLSTDKAPLWMLRDGAKATVESWESESGADRAESQMVTLWGACSVCGRASERRFCSGRCRGTAVSALALEQLRLPDFENSSSFLEYILRNPTTQFPWVDKFQNAGSAAKRIDKGTTLLEVWEASNRNWRTTIAHLLNAYGNHKATLKTALEQSDNDIKIAVSALSGKSFKETIDALTASGVEVGRLSVVSAKTVRNLRNLSESAKQQITRLESRTRSLRQATGSRLIDSFTLWYFGASKELYDIVKVKNPLSLEVFEKKFANRFTDADPTVREEFDELLMAIAEHPIVPNELLVENLEVGLPRVLLLAESHYQQRLLKVLNQDSAGKVSPSRKRLIRLLRTIELVGRGRTLEEIGKELDVTRERVRQLLEPVVAQFGLENLPRLREFVRSEIVSQSSRISKKILWRIDQISTFIREHPGISQRELAEMFPDCNKEIVEAIRRHPALTLDQFPIPEEPEFEEREDILTTLRSASLLKFPLTGGAYDQLLAEGFVKGVSRVRILQVYGSWTEACARAGVESGEVLKNVEYVRRYSQREMLQVVGSFLLDDDLKGGSGGAHSYVPWRAEHELAESIPSWGTIRNYISASWVRVRQLALVELRKSWDIKASERS